MYKELSFVGYYISINKNKRRMLLLPLYPAAWKVVEPNISKLCDLDFQLLRSTLNQIMNMFNIRFVYKKKTLTQSSLKIKKWQPSVKSNVKKCKCFGNLIIKNMTYI